MSLFLLSSVICIIFRNSDFSSDLSFFFFAYFLNLPCVHPTLHSSHPFHPHPLCSHPPFYLPGPPRISCPRRCPSLPPPPSPSWVKDWITGRRKLVVCTELSNL